MKKALSISAFSSSLLAIFPLASNKGWRLSLALFLLLMLFVKTFFVVPYNSGQPEF